MKIVPWFYVSTKSENLIFKQVPDVTRPFFLLLLYYKTADNMDYNSEHNICQIINIF